MAFDTELKRLQQEEPEWLFEAQQVLNAWQPTSGMLIEHIAHGLKDLYLRGAKGGPVGKDAPCHADKKGTRPRRTVNEPAPVRVRKPVPEKPTTVERVRRHRT